MPAWINEFHYDNNGTDTGEFVEIAATAGTDLTGWSLVRYNGANGQSYSSPAVTSSNFGPVSDQTATGFGFVTINYRAGRAAERLAGRLRSGRQHGPRRPQFPELRGPRLRPPTAPQAA